MKEFKQLVTEAKERFSNDPEMMGVLEEMESDVSLQSVVTGTLLTWVLSQEDITNEHRI